MISGSGKDGKKENVGLVRFELTIDGSLRHASVLQRVIIKHPGTHTSYPVLLLTGVRKMNSGDPLFIICSTKNAKTAGARRHSGLGHNPPVTLGTTILPIADCTKSR